MTWLEDFLTSKWAGSFTALAPPLRRQFCLRWWKTLDGFGHHARLCDALVNCQCWQSVYLLTYLLTLDLRTAASKTHWITYNVDAIRSCLLQVLFLGTAWNYEAVEHRVTRQTIHQLWILTLKLKSSRTRNGNATDWRIRFSFNVCSTCFSLTTYTTPNNAFVRSTAASYAICNKLLRGLWTR